MAINKKLINFKTKKLFLGPNGINKYLSATTLDSSTLNASWTNAPDANGFIGNIPWHSVVTIEDTNEEWSHGKFIGGNISGKTITLGGSTITVPSKVSDLTNDLRTSETKSSGTVTAAAGVTFDLTWNEVPKAIYDSILSESGTYLVLIGWGQAIYTGIFPYKELHLNTTYTSESLCPVITTDEEIVLTASGYIPTDKGRLYLKLKAGSRGTTEKIANEDIFEATKPSLFIATSKQGQSLDGLTFNFRRLI